jgi:hypothetical protein
MPHFLMEGNEPGLAELLVQVADSGKFQATSEYERLRDRDVILIAVETPVDEVSALRSPASCPLQPGSGLKRGGLSRRRIDHRAWHNGPGRKAVSERIQRENFE